MKTSERLLRVWEWMEHEVRLSSPPKGSPFTSVLAQGTALLPDGSQLSLLGFCASDDGSVFAFRYLATQPGEHRLTLSLTWEGGSLEEMVTVTATAGGLPGMVRAKAWGFEWSDSKQPFFWNSTTAYLMAGLTDQARSEALRRLADQGINRIRVAISPSRQKDGGRWMEGQIQESDAFTLRKSPWPLRQPDSVEDPQPITDRFDLGYWKSLDRLVSQAEDLGMIVQIIFFVDGQEPQNYPFDREKSGDDELERLYFDYALARLSAFPNIEWCVTNEWALFRPDEWVEARGRHVATRDPYGHLLSVHGHGHFPFRSSPWCTHALFQVWDEHGAGAWAKSERSLMLKEGVIKPIINEENGYEDHYPFPWGEGRKAPSRDWESRVRLSWEIVFAGAWCTVGERAGTSGGWINGLGEGESQLLTGLRHLKAFCEAFDLQATEAVEGVASGPTFCRSDGERLIAVWAPYGGAFRVKLPHSGPWTVRSFDPWGGEWRTLVEDAPLELDPYTGPGWATPPLPWGFAQAYLFMRV